MPESVKEPADEFKRPATLSDIITASFWICIVIVIFTTIDSCHAGLRYRDLRNRLERLEQNHPKEQSPTP